ncbi:MULTISPECIES: hypothetical protein [Gammaproteobacteria]|uniref:hypothetical protein n=1 Tax=Gammaproteobacteria TaxID=1236 RepID=UPI000DCFDF79|nr:MULTISPECIES: hypothetical protein [Gammaproteobacteria]RTE86923.1 hypothetical protein DQX04_00605 [Aliidiomarina sp. B3213]TCZ93287.1 hypothetical protein EYQ95_04695 [Lysobacter sp. N42]
MNLNVTLVGQTLFISALVTTLLTYFLSKGKVRNRMGVTILGFIGGLFQPIGIIVLIVLLLKKPIAQES